MLRCIIHVSQAAATLAITIDISIRSAVVMGCDAIFIQKKMATKQGDFSFVDDLLSDGNATFLAVGIAVGVVLLSSGKLSHLNALCVETLMRSVFFGQ